MVKYADFLTHNGPMPHDGIIREVEERNALAALECQIHAENYRLSRMFQKETPR